MGSDQRFDYSVLGDDVNLASRLEGQSKYYGVHIVIGENTRNMCPDMASIELDLIKVKGKNEAVRVFTLLGDTALAASAEFKQLAEHWMAMLDAYRSQNWQEALDLLKQTETAAASTDCEDLSGLFTLYRGRIEEYQASPPGEGWDGVYVATSK
jgi:adenylate cyclase